MRIPNVVCVISLSSFNLIAQSKIFLIIAFNAGTDTFSFFTGKRNLNYKYIKPLGSDFNRIMRHSHSFLRTSPRNGGDASRRALLAKEGGHEDKSALIILNMPIKAKLSRAVPCDRGNSHEDEGRVFTRSASSVSSVFERLWRASDLRICADGGANRLYDATILTWSKFLEQEASSEEEKQANQYIPDAIVGDLDSIRDEVKEYYQRCGLHGRGAIGEKNSGLQVHHQHSGCRIVRNPDENSNDFEKALAYIKAQQDESMRQSSMDDLHHDTFYHKWKVYVYGAFDGRFDQTMASIHALYKWKNVFECLVLYNEETSARLLLPHVTNTIRVDQLFEGPACGLLPIGCRCDKITTTGLKWNFSASKDNEEPDSMEFGGLISTSNIVTEDVVTVTCAQPVVWTTEIKPLIKELI